MGLCTVPYRTVPKRRSGNAYYVNGSVRTIGRRFRIGSALGSIEIQYRTLSYRNVLGNASLLTFDLQEQQYSEN